MNTLPEIWTYLAQEPLLWLTATLIAYAIGDALFGLSGKQIGRASCRERV